MDLCPGSSSKILLSHYIFKRKMGKNLSESLRQKAGFCIILHCTQTRLTHFSGVICPGVLPAGFFRGTGGVIENKV